MHFYRKTIDKDGKALFTMGYWEPIELGRSLTQQSPGGLRWVALCETTDEFEAMALVNYMNGGAGQRFVYTDEDKGLRDLIRERIKDDDDVG